MDNIIKNYKNYLITNKEFRSVFNKNMNGDTVLISIRDNFGENIFDYIKKKKIAGIRGLASVCKSFTL